MIVDEQGGPLGIVIAGANVNDHKLLEQTIEAIVVDRPKPTQKNPQHLCLDKDYDNGPSKAIVGRYKYTPHIERMRQLKKPCPGTPGNKPRRWVVERTLAWLSKCRAILVRYDKHDFNYLGLLQLACGLLWYRRKHRLTNKPPNGF